jgi:hypothetical protein
MITTLMNSGQITGGNGGAGFRGGAGGAGLSNLLHDTIGSLTNQLNGTIKGGSAGAGFGASGGVGVSNAGTITTLTNNGAINGGQGAMNALGGAGRFNGGTITTPTNGADGTISGATGAAAVLNDGSIGTMTNSERYWAGPTRVAGRAALGS